MSRVVSPWDLEVPEETERVIDTVINNKFKKENSRPKGSPESALGDMRQRLSYEQWLEKKKQARKLKQQLMKDTQMHIHITLSSQLEETKDQYEHDQQRIKWWLR